jgi:branched-chain amino acid transport system permease protein
MQYLVHLLINGIAVGALYGVVAMCFVLVYKTSRAINFAQGEFVLVGAWLCWWLLAACHLPFVPGLLLTLVFMLMFGALIQIIVLRPLLGRPAISVIMATIGLSIFLQALMKWMFGVFAQPFPHVFLATTLPIFGIEIRTVYVFSLVASLLIMAGLALFFKMTRWGLAMRATAFDQQVALSLGIPVKRALALAWALSAMVSAIAGMVAGVVNGVSSGLSFFGIKVFPAVILGGLDSLAGAVIGGLTIGVLENLAQWLDAEWLGFGNLYEIAPFYALILILLVRPNGLFGTPDIERV